MHSKNILQQFDGVVHGTLSWMMSVISKRQSLVDC